MERRLVYGLLLLLLSAWFVLSGCGDDDNPVNPTPPAGAEWQVLILDADEGLPANLDSLSVLVTDTSLVFRVVTHSPWADPYDPDGGVNAAIFLDLDTNAATGLSEDSGYPYRPDDIGADQAVIVGVEGDGMFSWDAGTVNWASPVEPTSLSLAADTTCFEVELNFSLIGYPDVVDIVAATVTWVDDEAYYDFGPDDGHVSLTLEANVASIDEAVELQPARNVQHPPLSAWRR